MWLPSKSHELFISRPRRVLLGGFGACLVAACAPPPPTSVPATRPAEPAGTHRVERGETTELAGDSLFVEGTAELTDQGRARIRELAAGLRAQGDVSLVVRGYTDEDGSAAFNISLSEERALSVRDQLISEGFSPNRVLARGLGPRFPVASNENAEGRARNRRITIEVRPGSSN